MSVSPIAKHVERLLANPHLLESPSSIHFGAFLYGYLQVDAGVDWIRHGVLRWIDGPSELDAWSRAYLRFGETEGFVLAAQETLRLLERAPSVARPVPLEDLEWFMTQVCSAAKLNRAAMFLGEVTIARVFNYGLGWSAAAFDYYPVKAAAYERELFSFENWLQRWSQAPGVPWHRIVRVFVGAGEAGIADLAQWWDEYSEHA